MTNIFRLADSAMLSETFMQINHILTKLTPVKASGSSNYASPCNWTVWWCTEANEATQTHCYYPVAPAYPIWAYYVHGQRICQEDPVSLPSGRLENTTRSPPHHVTQHRPTGSETTPPYAPRSSRFSSELPSMEDDVDVWRYTMLELHARNDDGDSNWNCKWCIETHTSCM